MSESALARAQRAIARALAGADTLDLHGLGLKTVPPLPAALGHLRHLDLSGNRLREVPPDVWTLTGLESLDLAGNRLGSLGAEIGELRSIRSLDLSENRLTALPSALAACTQLQLVNLFANQFATLPPVLLELSALRQLRAARNRLEILPNLARLTDLELLDLASNRLSAVSPELAVLPRLRVLDLSGNRLTSVEVAALPSGLESLYLDDNHLTRIPDSLPAGLRISVWGNPLAETSEATGRSAEALRDSSLRDLVTGGYEPGRRYFEAPQHHFGFVLALDGTQAVADSVDLYYKAFDGTPISLRLGDRLSIDLSRMTRTAALDIAALSDHARLEFPSTAETGAVEGACRFVERAISRIPGATLAVSAPDSGTSPTAHEPHERKVAAPRSAAAVRPAWPADRLPVTIRAAPQLDSSSPAAEPVDTAVFCPREVSRDSVFIVQVFLYRPGAAQDAAKQAAQVDETAEQRSSYSLPLDVPLGARVDIRLEMPLLTVPEPDAVLVWRGATTAAQFEVAVPREVQASTAIGRVRLAVSGLPAGTARFQVGIAAAGTSSVHLDARQLRARRYRRAFVSYSSADRAEVLRRVQAFQIAGLSVFQDVLALDPGERWQAALYREIDACDVFLLFWSRAAAASPWVLKEIEYALARKQGDDEQPPDIQPVPIEGPPIAPPPPGLSGIHFNDALLAQIQAADN